MHLIWYSEAQNLNKISPKNLFFWRRYNYYRISQMKQQHENNDVKSQSILFNAWVTLALVKLLVSLLKWDLLIVEEN